MIMRPRPDIELPDFCLVLALTDQSEGRDGAQDWLRQHFTPDETFDWRKSACNPDLLKSVRNRLQARVLTCLIIPPPNKTDIEHFTDLTKATDAPWVLLCSSAASPTQKIAESLLRHLQTTDRRDFQHIINVQIDVRAGSAPRTTDIDKPNRFSSAQGATNQSPTSQTGPVKTGPVKVDLASTPRLTRTPLWTDLRHLTGSFDIIGDVHGCSQELEQLLAKLGYDITWKGTGPRRWPRTRAPQGRQAVFVGDLVDRGPSSPDVLKVVMEMCRRKQALCVPGNHDVKFERWLRGSKVKLNHGLEKTAAQLEHEAGEFKQQVMAFLASLPTHLWLDGGKLAVAHAGLKERMFGRVSKSIRRFCLYGETSGETDEYGLPVRYNWATEYAGSTTVVYGHTPVPDTVWLNNTLCIDTGCCFGGRLTALRWPERTLVSVPALAAYAPLKRPMAHPPARPKPVVETI
ncbi:MAG: metallophosphoesterase [Pseudomonadota bacterium]